MEINGIKISDMKDAQDILMALEIIKGGLENISDDLGNNYYRYESLNNGIEQISDIIDSLSTLQTKGVNIIDNINSTGKSLKSMNDNNILMLDRKLRAFESNLENIINNTVNGINLKQFENQVEKLFNNKIKELSSQVLKLESNNNKLNTVNNNLKQTIDTVGKDLKNSIEDFNNINSSVTWGSLSLAVLVGVFIGAAAMGGFGLNMIENTLYEDKQIAIFEYQEAKKEYDTKKKQLDIDYAEADRVERLLRGNIEFFHKFGNTDEHTNILIIKQDKIKDDGTTNSGNMWFTFK